LFERKINLRRFYSSKLEYWLIPNFSYLR